MTIDNLLAHSSMEIYEFAIHVRQKMDTTNRVLPYYVMSYLKQGDALLRIEGREYRLLPKSVVIIPAGVKHDHISIGDAPAVFLWWHFNYKLYQTLDFLKILRLPITFDMKDNLAFEQAFEEYIELSNSATLRSVVMKKARALEIMALLLGAAEDEALNQRRLDSPDNFYTMLEEIIAGKDEESVSLEAFAEKYNMHPTYISNQFKKLFGISPIALAREIKVQRATYMLKDKNMSVGDVANTLGFKDISTFSRFYSSKTGMAPTHVHHEMQRDISNTLKETTS